MLWKIGGLVVFFLAADMFLRNNLPGLSPFLYLVLASLACTPMIALLAFLGGYEEQEKAEKEETLQRREEEAHQARLDAIRNPKP